MLSSDLGTGGRLKSATYTSETDSPDTPRNLFTPPIDHGSSATPDDISDHAWDGPVQGSIGSSTVVTTTGHNYAISYGENSGDTATDL